MLGRIIGSLVAIGTYETIMILFLPWLLLSSGQVAGGQFDNSDSSFVYASLRIGFNRNFGGMPLIVLFVVLLAIWWAPLRHRFGKQTITTAFGLLLGVAPAQAYYDKTDYTAAYTIPAQ